MAILEQIRKRTLVLILVIGLALFAFVISDAIGRNTGTTETTPSSAVAEINGDEIVFSDFRKQVEYLKGRGARGSEVQLVNQIWNQELRKKILGQEFDELGINVGNEQILDFLKANPSIANNPEYQNEAGLFDEDRFIDFIRDITSQNPSVRENWVLEEKNIIWSAKQKLYLDLVKAGTLTSFNEGENEYRQESERVTFKFVYLPYSSIPDSTITVDKKEIQQYIKKHENEYEQEATRDMQYVYFEEKATPDDINNLKTTLRSWIEPDSLNSAAGLKNTDDPASFVNIAKSEVPFADRYQFKKQLPPAMADSLLALNKGEILGPYEANNMASISRLLDKIQLADSVKASHIIVPWAGTERADPLLTRTKEEARKLIDSIFPLVRNNSEKYAQIADTLNTDGTKGRGGDLGWIVYSTITDATFDRNFSDFMFFNTPGSIEIVETKFGYHIIRVDERGSLNPAVKLATVGYNISASKNTVDSLFADATKFELAVTNQNKDFTKQAEEINNPVRPVNNVKALDENLPGLSGQRNIVRWIYEDEREIGDIKRFDLADGSYAVVQLVAKKKKGLKSTEEASATVLPILRKEKKAAQLLEKNKGKTLEQLAVDNSVVVNTATSVGIKSPTIPGAGREAAVVGKVFSLEKDETSGLLEGENGILMVQLVEKTNATDLDTYASYSNRLNSAARGRINTQIYDALKEKAEIEDFRAKFY